MTADNIEATAFDAYIKDCDAHAIVPDVAGAFHWAWTNHDAAREQDRARAAAPIDMVLHCPACGMQHIDAPESNDRYLARSDPPAEWSMPPWKNEPHRSHLCHGCGHIWRPADVPTNGVAAVRTTGKNDRPTPAAPQAAVGVSDEQIKALWIEATNGNHGDTTQDFVRWFARAVLALSPATKPEAPAEDCGNCFEGETDRGHKCKVCGGTGKPAEAPANAQNRAEIEHVSADVSHVGGFALPNGWNLRRHPSGQFSLWKKGVGAGLFNPDDPSPRLSVAAAFLADLFALAAPAQGAAVPADVELLELIENLMPVRIERCRVGSPKGPLVWDVEYGLDEHMARGPTLREALEAARQKGGV